MAALKWDSDDPGYERWVHGHPHGFLANTKRPVGGRYFRIHCASCNLQDRSKPETINPRTGNRYLKITADTIAELIAWAEQELHLSTFGDQNYCKICAPRSANP